MDVLPYKDKTSNFSVDGQASAIYFQLQDVHMDELLFSTEYTAYTQYRCNENISVMTSHIIYYRYIPQGI